MLYAWQFNGPTLTIGHFWKYRKYPICIEKNHDIIDIFDILIFSKISWYLRTLAASGQWTQKIFNRKSILNCKIVYQIQSRQKRTILSQKINKISPVSLTKNFGPAHGATKRSGRGAAKSLNIELPLKLNFLRKTSPHTIFHSNKLHCTPFSAYLAASPSIS